jgi:hypothetical protein
MSLTFSLVLALQVSVNAEAKRDTIRIGGSINIPTTRTVPVTDEHRRTAFKDPIARDIILRARVTRTQQDSALRSYDAKSYMRISVGLKLRETARDRLIFRAENASNVHWNRANGVRVEVLGARMAVPIVQGIKEAEKEIREDPDMEDMFTIPYLPGNDELWLLDMFGGGNDSGNVIVHPIAEGSEAFFTFESGETISMTLPDGTRLDLREIRVIPRVARWNLVVGTLWFEVERAYLVRAAFRFSEMMDPFAIAREEDPDFDEDVPWLVKGAITPMQATMSAITVEYGLFEQRFWLPRGRSAEFFARAGLFRVPGKIEQKYRYDAVNSGAPFEPVVLPAEDTHSDSAMRDSLAATGLDSAAVRQALRAFHAQRDTAQAIAREAECTATGFHTTYDREQNNIKVPTLIRVPCDRDKLENSPDLPPSIYDPGEELFGSTERDELMKMLDFGLQPAWAPKAPTLAYGLGLTRFNRIEGLSSGLQAQSILGKGYTATMLGRASLADAQLNGEFSLERSNGRRAYKGTVYRRLVPSVDFGDPFTMGASVGALLYALDEGFYHRAWGVDVTGSLVQTGGLEWRLFGEEQWSASVESEWSLFGGAHDDRFGPNVVASRAKLAGASIRWRGSRGLDPRGWRLNTDVRLEGAGGDFEYGRGLLETSVSRGLGRIAASVTGAVGSSTGELPPQRQFFLGGLHTIRGQEPGTAVGEAFWMTRLELGTNVAAYRPVIYGDLGWAGPRSSWGQSERPMAGVGVGMSLLDGMFRVDLARGIHPRWHTRLDFYFEARF